ncbi:MAG TPA: enoyl-CoA hydratase/isomerase family protein [Leptospiraceae bacterium]|nr:enoyl-CoA hydratase/isomerase family protein [Leptospirales bacterium]HMW60141.1 enoyl-CoA hydratase/isomerase family protein [Leptospiraceae bacterium]HMX58562.1 enoyl-CoA hydratase/isomerase family protein [Leptospiraceae bacterium]HQI18794.1 enoyl-CoA hydratase/isomerase family protein [Leptospiraceae bacterium]
MNFKRERIDLKGSQVEIISIQTNEQNSFTRAALLEFRALMDELRDDRSVKAVAFASENEKFFSNGVDAATIATTPSEHLAEEMGEIVKFFGHLLQFYKPLVCEISGHAMGGGAVIALACDFRFMLNQKGRVSFTEVFFGLPLPGVFIDKLKYTVSPSHLNDMVYGETYKAQEALSAGFVNAIADSREDLRKLTMRKLEALTRIPSSAFIHTKASLLHETVSRIEFHAKATDKNFSDPTIRGNLMEAMKSFTEGRRPKFSD